MVYGDKLINGVIMNQLITVGGITRSILDG